MRSDGFTSRDVFSPKETIGALSPSNRQEASVANDEKPIFPREDSITDRPIKHLEDVKKV